jgi:hypothetical protein
MDADKMEISVSLAPDASAGVCVFQRPNQKANNGFQLTVS